MSVSSATSPLHAACAAAAESIRATNDFGPVAVSAKGLEAAAKDAGAPASYRVFADGGRVWVALVTADRWLSQSIEQDLVHTGDKLTDLVEEELIDLGYLGLGVGSAKLPVEHFRDDDKLFTFRTPIPVDADRPSGQPAAVIALCVRGYEACFRRLGDMEAGDDD